jgi:hypothetical protein
VTARRNFAAAAAIPLLAVVAVATVGSELAPRRVDPCADPTRLLDPTAIDSRSVPTKEAEWGAVESGKGVRKGRIESDDPRDATLIFMLYRNWGLPIAMQNPGQSIPGNLEADRIRVRQVDVGGGTIPVQVADQTSHNVSHFAMYTFAYDGRAVTSAFRTRMGSILDEFVDGSPPITVMAISARTRLLDHERAEARAEEWMRAAWSHYLDACGFAPASGAP